MFAAHGAWEGQQVLSPAAIDEMVADQVGEAVLAPGEFVERARGAKHRGVYGLGLWRERVDRAGRATRVSSPSWAGTYPWIDAELAIYGVLLAHVDLGGPRWERGFNPFYSSAAVARWAAAAVASAEP